MKLVLVYDLSVMFSYVVSAEFVWNLNRSERIRSITNIVSW